MTAPTQQTTGHVDVTLNVSIPLDINGFGTVSAADLPTETGVIIADQVMQELVQSIAFGSAEEFFAKHVSAATINGPGN